jgi:glycosyltransferase involved in cell wall biosynthesis
MKAVAEVFQSVSEGGHTIIGDGPERRRLERLAEDLGIAKQVRFLGSVSYAEVAKELRSSDIYVSAVPTDGTSSSLLEAMACGIFPVVVDNAPNRLWIRHGYNGFLYPAGNISALAQLLASAIADPKLRADAATLNVKEVKKRADWKTNMKVMEERHLDLCGQTVLGNTRDFSGVK